MNDLLSFLPADLLPDVVSPVLAAGLLLLSCLTSLITASLGAGGGLLLLATLSITLPPLAIIPIHGAIQLGSNLSRASMAVRHIHWPTIGYFAPGLLLGVLAGSFILVQLPPSVFQCIIGVFVLYLCWGPALPSRALKPKGIAALGAGTTFLSLFVGATGPLVSAFFKRLYTQRFVTVATVAAALSIQHMAKIVVFGVAGFEYTQWLALIAGMIIMGAVGTKLGLILLGKLSDHHFSRYLNILLTLMALRLIWQATYALWFSN